MALVHMVAKGKRQSILFIDGDAVGPVQNADMCFLSVQESDDISSNKLTEILQDYVLPAGRKKALDLLLAEDRTEIELKRRLIQAGYGESIVASIMEYVKQYPYLNDVRYALNYMRSVGTKKSLLEIRHKLTEKGVSDEDFEKALGQYREERQESMEGSSGELCEEDIEYEAVLTILHKKVAPGTPLTRAQKEKLYASLLRKGFGYHNVRKALKEYSTVDEDME